jgi:4-oxalocrotonate tautomerase
MPFVNVKLIEGVFTPEQKQQIVRDLTDAMVAIAGENMRQVTWVVVEEVHSGDWGHRRIPAQHCERQGPRGRRAGRLVTPPAALLASGREKARRGRALGRCPRPALGPDRRCAGH